VSGDRSAFHHCRFLGHQDTLYADSPSVSTAARQFFSHCYVEGDVDFVFGRGRAVFEHCRFHTLARDVDFTPKGMVFAPSTARDNPYGYLAVRCRISSGAEDGAYKLSRPWVPSSDPTAWPSLVVRDSVIGPGIDAVEPYTNMRDAYPWQAQRYAEYRNTGPGARITVPEKPAPTGPVPGEVGDTRGVSGRLGAVAERRLTPFGTGMTQAPAGHGRRGPFTVLRPQL
jgi:pectinesterase